MIDRLIEAAAHSIPIEAGDYQRNGIWYCGKCDTPKQCIIMFDGVERRPMCMCKCRREAWDAAEAQDRIDQRNAKINQMREAGFDDAEMRRFTFAQDDGKNARLTRIAQRYVDTFDTMLQSGKGLLFYGTVGTGKTFAAACIANALIDKGIPCLMTNFARVTNIVSSMRDERKKFLDGLNRYSLLIIDDLASERGTDYMVEMVQSVIDARYRARLPLIVTTNLTGEELKRPADIRKERLYSRLFEMCLPVEINGADRRRSQLRRDMQRFGELLGLNKEG